MVAVDLWNKCWTSHIMKLYKEESTYQRFSFPQLYNWETFSGFDNTSWRMHHQSLIVGHKIRRMCCTGGLHAHFMLNLSSVQSTVCWDQTRSRRHLLLLFLSLLRPLGNVIFPKCTLMQLDVQHVMLDVFACLGLHLSKSNFPVNRKKMCMMLMFCMEWYVM